MRNWVRSRVLGEILDWGSGSWILRTFFHRRCGSKFVAAFFLKLLGRFGRDGSLTMRGLLDKLTLLDCVVSVTGLRLIDRLIQVIPSQAWWP